MENGVLLMVMMCSWSLSELIPLFALLSNAKVSSLVDILLMLMLIIPHQKYRLKSAFYGDKLENLDGI